MDKAVAQTLNGLIPEYNSPLPPELLELAVSLLAQSRNKASSLKPEEEIARSYACAHLACERLKQHLGLPRIQPRPPCPPRVYQKLYRHLDSALAAGARRTPRTHKAAKPTTSSRTPNVTPRKSGPTTTRTPVAGRNKRKREPTISDDVPAWVMPAIRGLCKGLTAPSAPPHIFAGISSILTLPPPVQGSLGDSQLEHVRSMSLEALIVAVYILVRTRLSGIQTDPKGYSAQRDDAINLIRELRKDEDDISLVNATSVDGWMREVAKGQWTKMDWFENIQEGAGLAINQTQTRSQDDSDIPNSDEDEDMVVGRNRLNWVTGETTFLKPSLGTIMQSKINYLSDEKRADYQKWKKGILKRVEQLEKSQQVETSAG